MTFESDLRTGARNLLLNCAELKQEESVVIISEDPRLGWYEPDVAEALFQEAGNMGIIPTLLEVGKPSNQKDPVVVKAVDSHDCAIFLARIGDQDRFEAVASGKKTVMCYARDVRMLASTYGCADYRAFLHLKQAVNDILFDADTVRITCGHGTDISGEMLNKENEMSGDVSVRRFPLGVPQPLNASQMSGRVALVNYLTPTGSRVYEPAAVEIENIVFAEVSRGLISSFTGKLEVVEKIREHYKMVSEKFNIQGDNVHSFHAGIHPGCSYLSNAIDNPDRWANTVFTNPRVLHFHTCGNYSPGEICWMVIDHTLSIDNKNLWEDGRLCVNNFEQTRQCLKEWPELKSMFICPEQSIGLR
jgi:hypothetical protein